MNDSKEKQQSNMHDTLDSNADKSHSSASGSQDEGEEDEEPMPEDENNSLYMSQIQYKELKE